MTETQRRGGAKIRDNRKTHNYRPSPVSLLSVVVLSVALLSSKKEEKSLGTGQWGRREQGRGWMSGEGWGRGTDRSGCP